MRRWCQMRQVFFSVWISSTAQNRYSLLGRNKVSKQSYGEAGANQTQHGWIEKKSRFRVGGHGVQTGMQFWKVESICYSLWNPMDMPDQVSDISVQELSVSMLVSFKQSFYLLIYFWSVPPQFSLNLYSRSFHFSMLRSADTRYIYP